MARYYLLGVKGAGVSAMALFLKDLGNEVIGYDDAEEHRFTEDPLRSKRPFRRGYDDRLFFGITENAPGTGAGKRSGMHDL